jgi:ABC-type phosphate/phosphonate transport system substrate-binding protein
MTGFVAALPMYDWPELRAETDAQWARLRDALRRRGVDAPQALTRENGASGGLDLAALWRDPALLFAQTCWGPMGLGLSEHVQVLGQPDYSDCEGGEGEFYSSALMMRGPEGGAPAPADGHAVLPLDLLRGRRLAFNSEDSMSGILALTHDLEVLGESLSLFPERIETGGHRASLRAVAEGRADIAAVDCRSWALFKRLEPDVSARLQVACWTARRKGLPYICARTIAPETVAILREALASAGMLAAG